MLRRESYLTFPDQKDANGRFYIRVGTPKYLVTKPIENQVNIVTTLVTRIKAWKSRNQWKGIILMSCPLQWALKYSFQLIFLKSIFEFTINTAPQASNGVYGRETAWSVIILLRRHLFSAMQRGPVVWGMLSRAGGWLLCSFN